MKRIHFGTTIIILAIFTVAPLVEGGKNPLVIQGVRTLDSSTPCYLDIYGQNFGENEEPIVTLDGEELVVVGFTSTFIRVQFDCASFRPAEYILQVERPTYRTVQGDSGPELVKKKPNRDDVDAF